MRTTKTNLLAALELPLSVVGTRSTLPILSCVRIEASGGRLTITATNLDHSAELHCECDGDLKSVCVNASAFSRAIQFGAEEIGITIPKAGQLQIDNGSKIVLPTLEAKEFPPVFTGKTKAIGINCEDLAAGIKAVGWCAHTDQVRYTLCGTHVLGTPNRLVAEASNGSNLAHYEQPAIEAACEFILPSEFHRAAIECLLKPESVLSLSENQLRIEFQGGKYECKLIEGNYPNTKPIVDEERAPLGTIPHDEWLGVMQFIYSSGQNKLDGGRATLHFADKSCLMEHQSRDGFSFDKTFDGRFKKLDAEINVGAFAKILNAFPAESEIKLSHTDKNIAMEHGNLKVIMMLVAENKKG